MRPEGLCQRKIPSGRKALLKILDNGFRSLSHLLHASGVMIPLQVPTICSVRVTSHRVPISKLPVLK